MPASDPPTRLPQPRPRGGALRVHVCDGRGRPRRERGLGAWLANVVPGRYRGEVTVALVGDATSRRLNREYRGIDRPTDVLSFPTSHVWSDGRSTGKVERAAGEAPCFGDIVIATGVAARQARALGHSLSVELRVLALHGFLHLIGYDHERDQGVMRRIERAWRRRGGLSSSLTERAEGS